VKAVRFELVEALRFAAGHTGGIEVYSKELAYALPLPSTVLGALGAALGVQLGGGVCRKPLADLEALAEKLGGGTVDLFAESCERPLPWGPLLEAGDRYYFARGNELVEADKLTQYVRGALERRGFGEVAHRLRPSTHFGLKLSERRVAEPGYAYKAALYGYDLKPYSASLVYAANIAAERAERLVRLGGEGRVAGLAISDPPEKLVELLSGEGEYAVALSPVLFYAEGEVAPGSTLGLREVEEVVGVPTSRSVKLRVENVGLGFSEVCKQRRPLLQALPPGTVLKPRDRSLRAVGLLSCLGYGSLLRVST